MKWRTVNPVDLPWRRVFAWLPVELFNERYYGQRAWLTFVERKFVPIAYPPYMPVYRPIGSDWEYSNRPPGPPPAGGGTGIKPLREGRCRANIKRVTTLYSEPPPPPPSRNDRPPQTAQ